MPTVPDGPSVAPASIPDARFFAAPSETALGGGAGRQRAADQVSSLAQESRDLVKIEQARADQVASVKYRSGLTNLETDLLYNPETGLMQTRGQNAFLAPEAASKRFQEGAAELQKSISPRQATMFQAERDQSWSNVNRQVQHHVSQQRFEYAQQETKSLIDNETNAAINAVGTADQDRRIAEARAKIENAVEGFEVEHAGNFKAVDDGFGNVTLKADENAEAAKAAAMSDLHSNVIASLLAKGMDDQAKAYFVDNAQEIGRKVKDNLETAIEVGQLRGQSMRSADKIVAGSDDRLEALAKVDKIEEPKLRKATEERVNHIYSQRREALKERQDDIFNSSLAELEKTGTMDSIPPTMISEILKNSPKDFAILRKREKELQDGTEVENFSDSYYALRQLAVGTGDDKKEFMSTNLARFKGNISRPDLERLTDLQTKMKEGKGAANTILDGYQTDTMIVNGNLKTMGINPNPKPGSADAKIVNDFRRLVDQQVTLTQSRSGKKVTNAELQEIVDVISARSVTTPGRFFDSKKRIFELQPGEGFGVNLKDVPVAERKKIEAFLTRNRMPITDQAIVQWYQRRVQSLVGQ